MPSHEFSRREMLGLFGVGMAGLEACGFGGREFYVKHNVPVIPAYSQEQFPPQHDVFLANPESSYDLNPDPLFRAANVSVLIGSGGNAHASLINNGNDYILSTAEHVARAVQYSSISSVQIPGVGTTLLDPERFIFGTRHGKERETSAFYIFGEENQAIIKEAMSEKKIQPLQMKSGLPKKSEIVAIPQGERGSYSLYQYDEYYPFENLFTLQGSSENCSGDSGSPILEIEKMQQSNEINPTGAFYGTLQGASESRTELDGRACSSLIFARPNR